MNAEELADIAQELELAEARLLSLESAGPQGRIADLPEYLTTVRTVRERVHHLRHEYEVGRTYLDSREQGDDDGDHQENVQQHQGEVVQHQGREADSS
jgi:hypothetical protein